MSAPVVATVGTTHPLAFAGVRAGVQEQLPGLRLLNQDTRSLQDVQAGQVQPVELIARQRTETERRAWSCGHGIAPVEVLLVNAARRCLCGAVA